MCSSRVAFSTIQQICYTFNSYSNKVSTLNKYSVYNFCDNAKIGVFKSHLDTHELIVCNDYMATIMDFNSASELITHNKNLSVNMNWP